MNSCGHPAPSADWAASSSSGNRPGYRWSSARASLDRELNASSGFLHHHQRLQTAAVAAHNQAPALLANGQTQLMVPIPRGEGIRAQAPMACGIHLHGSGYIAKAHRACLTRAAVGKRGDHQLGFFLHPQHRVEARLLNACVIKPDEQSMPFAAVVLEQGASTQGSKAKASRSWRLRCNDGVRISETGTLASRCQRR